MPRRRLRLEPNEQERKALAKIKRVHKAGGQSVRIKNGEYQIKDAGSNRWRRVFRPGHVPALPGFKVRLRNDKWQFKGMGFGQWRDYTPREYANAKAERDYLANIEKTKRRRVSGGAEARKAQGEARRRSILDAWEESSKLPERNRAAAVAKKLSITARHVRRVVRSRSGGTQ